MSNLAQLPNTQCIQELRTQAKSLSERVQVFAGTNGPLFVNLTPDCKIFAWEKLLLLNKCLHANIPIQIVINTLWYQKKNHSRWGEVYICRVKTKLKEKIMHWAQVKTGIQHALLLNVTQKMLNSISFKNHAARNYTNQTSTVHNYQQGTHLQLLNNLIRGVKKNLPCLDVRIFIKSSKFCFLSIRLATIMA